ncbi:MAG: hypothetical protein VX642_14340 [Bdellovibrionota bacterium]|nr:hypothetical protein [Bdellovibrionota bacterium]
MQLSRLFKLFLIFQIVVLTACEDIPTVSILDETDEFEQSSSNFENKIDILWVIDNSGSMANLQANVANNFSSFITRFKEKSFDFQMAVTTTEAWREYYGNQYCGQQSNISNYRSNSGVTILDANTLNLEQAFLTNIQQGTAGCGDERALSSMVTALTNTENSNLDFPRSGAYLAVIVVSDEDDFSHDGGDYLWNDYNYAGLTPVQDFVDAMDVITGSTNSRRLYNVSTIGIFDEQCKDDNTPDGQIALRVGELSDLTDGIKASVCANNFAENLELIGEKIVILSSQFYLSREPVIESIEVIVDGSLVSQSIENGWQYIAESNSIQFYGDAIPIQGASIQINFDPVALKN